MPRHSSVLGGKGKAGSLQPASPAYSWPAAATKPSQGLRVRLQVGEDRGEPPSCLSVHQILLIVSKSVPSNHPRPSLPVLGDLISVRLQGDCLYGKRPRMCLVVPVGPGCRGEQQGAAPLALSGSLWLEGTGSLAGCEAKGSAAPRGEPP